MMKRDSVSPLESSAILRRFAFLFFAMSLIPVTLISHFYYMIKDLDLPEYNLVILLLLVVIGICMGYWGMRVVLRDLVNVVKIHTESLEHLLGSKKFKELTAGKNEIDVLAKTFDELIYQLEDNVRKLELTKKTLHSVLSKISDGMASMEDINVFLTLIVETLTDALSATSGALLLVDRETCTMTIGVTHGIEVDHFTGRRIKIRDTRLFGFLDRHEPFVSKELPVEDFPENLKTLVLNQPVLCAPLVRHDNPMGMIILCGREVPELDPDESQLFHNIVLQTSVAIENSRLNEDAEKTYFETISALALAVEAKDPYSRGHLERVAGYAVMIAHQLKLPEKDIVTLRDAARLHDIGKIGILDEVLRKPGKLTPAEMNIMRKHPEIGEGIISPIRSLRGLCEIVRHHHEYLDGSGYPDGLKDNEISLLTRILSVGDIYDALTTRRPYREALSSDAAKTIMTVDYAQKLDQRIVKILFETIG